MSVFQTVPRNTAGRDFVVGDIHGAFDSVAAAMKTVNFDGKVDRLFVVGDLIDRGPQSARVLAFLLLPYVFSIRGNHDDMFAKLPLVALKLLGVEDWNGMGWICSTSDETLLAIQKALAALPIAMEIDTVRGSVGLVHAEVPIGMDWPSFIERIQAGDPATIESALEGRDRIKSADSSGVAGIDRLFVGHTVQWDGVLRFGNVYMIDTGAVFYELDKHIGALTMANLVCRSTVLVQHAANPQATVAGIYSHELSEAPFGRYDATM